MTAQPPRTAPRPSALLVVWVLATAAGLLVAATTKIGPVVLSLTRTHGVHAGDLVGFAVFYGAALLATPLVRARGAADAVRPPASAPPPTPPGPARPDPAEAPTVRLRPAPEPLGWSDDPTRPVRPGTAHPDDPYGRRAG